jgi:rare lipoprotein A
MNTKPILAVLAVVLAVAGCSSTPPAKQASAPKDGGYYLDDGPEATPPENLDQVPDAVPRAEPLHRYANRAYAVQGNTYVPQTTAGQYRKEGLASWYGRRFHGKKTASGEKYDMYAMTAAHPTLPIPSYARVTSLNTGKSVVIRINDRGPFHSKRIIDLSYAAAHKLGYIKQGSTRVRVESIDPDTYAVQDAVPGQGLYLQVGAFSRADNAEQLIVRIARELELDADRTRVVNEGSLHRVQVGPYRSDDAAHADRARMRERLELNAVLVRRD